MGFGTCRPLVTPWCGVAGTRRFGAECGAAGPPVQPLPSNLPPALDSLWVQSVARQRLEHSVGVFRAAGLDREVERYALGGHVQEQAAMRHFKDICAELSKAGSNRA